MKEENYYFDNEIHDTLDSNSDSKRIILTYINSKEFKQFSDSKKLAFLIYLNNSSSKRLDNKFWILMQYLKCEKSYLLNEIDWEYNFSIDENQIDSLNINELENIFSEILQLMNINISIIHKKLQENENHKESIMSKIKLFKIRKYKFWYDDKITKEESIWKAIADIRFIALWWTHWDEKNALKWFNNLEWKIDTYLVNVDAVEKNTRESDEDINRPNTPWSDAYTRKENLKNEVKEIKWLKYFLDFHNCNWSSKLWCVWKYSQKNEVLAKALWLDALLVFEDDLLTQWTVISELEQVSWWEWMVIEVGNEIDQWWWESIKIAKNLLTVCDRIDMLKQNMNNANDHLTIDDIEEILWTTKSVVPIVYISILKDQEWKRITNDNNIPKEIPEYCIIHNSESWYYLKVHNGNWTYPQKDLVDKTIQNM